MTGLSKKHGGDDSVVRPHELGTGTSRRIDTAAAVGTDFDTLQRPHIARRLPGAFGTARHAHDACGTVGLLDPLSAIERFARLVANGIDLAGRHGRIGEQLFADEALQQLFLAR